MISAILGGENVGKSIGEDTISQGGNQADVRACGWSACGVAVIILTVRDGAGHAVSMLDPLP
jgi:hypothetical protein